MGGRTMKRLFLWLLSVLFPSRYLIEFEAQPGVMERHTYPTEREAREAFPFVKPTRVKR